MPSSYSTNKWFYSLAVHVFPFLGPWCHETSKVPGYRNVCCNLSKYLLFSPKLALNFWWHIKESPIVFFLTAHLDARLLKLSSEARPHHTEHKHKTDTSFLSLGWRMCRARQRSAASSCEGPVYECLYTAKDSLHSPKTVYQDTEMGKRLQTVAAMACMKTLLMLFNFVFWVS